MSLAVPEPSWSDVARPTGTASPRCRTALLGSRRICGLDSGRRPGSGPGRLGPYWSRWRAAVADCGAIPPRRAPPSNSSHSTVGASSDRRVGFGVSGGRALRGRHACPRCSFLAPVVWSSCPRACARPPWLREGGTGGRGWGCLAPLGCARRTGVTLQWGRVADASRGAGAGAGVRGCPEVGAGSPACRGTGTPGCRGTGSTPLFCRGTCGVGGPGRQVGTGRVDRWHRNVGTPEPGGLRDTGRPPACSPRHLFSPASPDSRRTVAAYATRPNENRCPRWARPPKAEPFKRATPGVDPVDRDPVEREGARPPAPRGRAERDPPGARGEPPRSEGGGSPGGTLPLGRAGAGARAAVGVARGTPRTPAVAAASPYARWSLSEVPSDPSRALGTGWCRHHL